jgi:Arc/MetJ-type ribon-helix-helix transcriptional regulator
MYYKNLLSGLMPHETLSATVNARVPRSEYDRIIREVKRRRSTGAWASVADVIRDALHKYFATRGELVDADCNGQH